MPKYWVQITEVCTPLRLEIDADNESDAYDRAIEMSEDGTLYDQHKMEVLDCDINVFEIKED